MAPKNNNNGFKHGHNRKNKRSGTYISWDSMIQRCNNPSNSAYKNYGGRGIKVCKRWLKFENFLEDMGNRPIGKTLNRIDNNKEYSSENCKWSTIKEQQRNMRNNHFIRYNNKEQCISALAEEYDINPQVLCGRLKLGWPIKKALITPIEKYRKK